MPQEKAILLIAAKTQTLAIQTIMCIIADCLGTL